MYSLLRPLLFALDAEEAHALVLAALARVPSWCPPGPAPRVGPIETMGLRFPNPVGLAAGLDKDGVAIDALARLGFGFIEVGTVTPRPQPGNPKPRLFRIPEAQAIINRFGFNNAGIDALVARAAKSGYVRGGGILGVNIGKNFDTPIERAADDYLIGLEKAYPVASYVTVNVSSPNTRDLRSLQGGESLDDLLGRLKAAQARLADRHGRHVPIALKVAPDLEDDAIDAIADAVRRHRVEGLVATNTTISREGVAHHLHGDEAGGLSGRPLLERSTVVLARFAERLRGEVALIGVGGIVDADGARAKFAAGAQLVQLYSGLIYRGPGLVAEVLRARQ
ncbi:MAG: Dihydroorotate dehydrogenase (quinone) [Rhodocyclaceae bacterium]|nr:quinone-dependent dihydroorotate dehydrogenase [Rhodocyclaceae bacterium]MCG3187921.1 Dihydroorotate dehydrogenase (quinone) [Rhodocyclaceae bacterium]